MSLKATSTLHYPALEPSYLRRGFIYKNIMVAPRQQSGLYTINIKFNNDFQYWISKYEGGELYETLLYNQVCIFVTHQGNYGNDRIANFLFQNVFFFLSTWTNLKFYSQPPLETVKIYFNLHPEEREPLWTVKSFLNIFNILFSNKLKTFI